jgi:hypothetical protein
MIPPELFDLIKSGGGILAPVFAILWWLERQERLKEREEHKTVAKDMITAMSKTEATLATLRVLFSGKGVE